MVSRVKGISSQNQEKNLKRAEKIETCPSPSCKDLFLNKKIFNTKTMTNDKINI
jgi:hypothetical protein